MELWESTTESRKGSLRISSGSWRKGKSHVSDAIREGLAERRWRYREGLSSVVMMSIFIHEGSRDGFWKGEVGDAGCGVLASEYSALN